MPGLRFPRGFAAPALLLAVTLGFFWKIAFTGSILTGYDTFAYFYPYLGAAADAIRSLRLPLWNPDVFLGAPLAANLQAALFYPSTLLLAFLPVGTAVSLDIILHTFLAAWFMYLLARHTVGLGRAGALAAGIAFAFSGFFAAQAGHVNQLSAAAWLPLLLLVYDLAQARASWIHAVAGALVLALILLAGHSQEAFMILCVLAARFVWTSAAATVRSLNLGLPPGRTLLRSVLLTTRMIAAAMRVNLRGVATLAVILAGGALLAAAQLVPSLELASLSVRSGGLGYRQAVSFSLNPLQLASTLLPGYWQNPFSEYVGYVGVTGVVLAAVGLRESWRRGRNTFYVAIAGVGLALALGGYTPLYLVGYLLIPGFGLFRVPARWLYLYTFGVAMLVGIGLDAVVRQAGRTTAPAGSVTAKDIGRPTEPGLGALRRALRSSPVLPLALGAIALGATVALSLPPLATWIVVALAAALLLRRLARATVEARSLWTAAILVLLTLELFVASRGMEYNQPTAPESLTSLRPALAHLLTDDESYRVLSLSTGLFDPGDLADFKAMLPSDLALQFATATKNKEILAPNTPMLFGIESVDGYDGGILPLKRYVELQQLFMNPWQVSVDGRLREQLTDIPDARLLSLLNVKYVLADKVNDVWVDNAYYDLGSSVVLSATNPAWISGDLPPFPTGSLGIITHLVGAQEVADGTLVASVIVRSASGQTNAYGLRAGADTSEGIYFEPAGPAARHGQARSVAAWRSDPLGRSYLARVALDRNIVPQTVEVRFTSPKGHLVVRALTQIDGRTGATQSVVVGGGALHLVHGGDVKLYENSQVLPRAFAVHQAQVFNTNRAVLDAMADPAFPISRSAVLVADGLVTTSLQTLAALPEATSDRIVLRERAAESVEISATMGANGLLVLTDMWYPGWRAYVDGVEQPLFRVYHVFRGVVVPWGEHRVEIRYDAAVWRAGALVGLAAWIALAVWLVCRWRSRKAKGAAVSPRPLLPR